MFERAAEWADNEGWVIEAAMARSQLAEASEVLNMPRLSVVEDERTLRDLGVPPEPVALRAALMSLRKTALSQREEEVLALVHEGLTARQMAARLDIAEGTVNTYLHRAKQKLGTDGMTGSQATATHRSQPQP